MTADRKFGLNRRHFLMGTAAWPQPRPPFLPPRWKAPPKCCRARPARCATTRPAFGCWTGRITSTTPATAPSLPTSPRVRCILVGRDVDLPALSHLRPAVRRPDAPRQDRGDPEGGNPTWRPTAAMKARHPEWPDVVEGGAPDNPLGVRALYLGWPATASTAPMTRARSAAGRPTAAWGSTTSTSLNCIRWQKSERKCC